MFLILTYIIIIIYFILNIKKNNILEIYEYKLFKMTTKMSYADKLKIGMTKQKDMKIEKTNEMLLDKYDYSNKRILNDFYIDEIGKYLIEFYVNDIISELDKITEGIYIRKDVTDYLWTKYIEGNKFMKKAVKYVFENYCNKHVARLNLIKDINLAFKLAFEGFKNIKLDINAKQDYEYFQNNIHMFHNKVSELYFEFDFKYYTIYEKPNEKYFPDGLKLLDLGYTLEFYNVSNVNHPGHLMKHVPKSIEIIEGLRNKFLTYDDKQLLRQNNFHNLWKICTFSYLGFTNQYKLFYDYKQGIIEN